MFCFFIFSKVFFCNSIFIVITLYSLWPEDFQVFFPAVKHDLQEGGRSREGNKEEEEEEEGEGWLAGKDLRDTDLAVVDYETKIGYR